MSESSKKRGFIIIIAGLCLVLMMLTACNKIYRREPNPYGRFEDNKYYRGYEGVEMVFVPGTPPYRLYYYGTQSENDIDVIIEVANIGSSWARGGVFIAGYDPTIIEFYGVNPLRSSGSACLIDVGNIGFGEFGATLRCEDFFIGGGTGGTFEFFFKDLFNYDGPYSGRFDLRRIFGNLNVYHRSSGDQQQWNIGFNNPRIDIEYANHGRLLIALFEGIDFSRNFGTEYLLAGDTYEYPSGDIDYIHFDGNIMTWPPGLDETYTTFQITNCFLYATYAAPVVCIDPAPYSQSNKVCVPRPYTGTNGQGAPVAVTHIEQENTPRQAVFRIHIRNVGGGQIYDPGRLEFCSPYSPKMVTNEDLNVVYIGDIRVSGDLQRLDCTPNDYVRIDPTTGEGIVTCAYNIPFAGLKSAYQAPLIVELWYGYSKVMEKRVLLKRAV